MARAIDCQSSGKKVVGKRISNADAVTTAQTSENLLSKSRLFWNLKSKNNKPIRKPQEGTKTPERPPNFSLRSEEHTSELQSLAYLVCRLLLEKKKKKTKQ